MLDTTHFRSTLASLGVSLAASLVVFAAGCSTQPDDPVAEAQLLIDERRVDEAIALLQRSLDRTPDDLELNRFYGATLLSMGEASQAIWPLDKAASSPEATPEDKLLLARAHLRGGSPADAIIVADRMLEETPDVLEAYEVRIEANIALNQNTLALEDVEYVLERRPDDQDLLLERATLLLELERPDEAQEAIAAAQEAMNEEDAEAWAARFCAIAASLIFERGEEGHIEGAQAAWDECLDAHGDDPLVVTEAVGFFDGQRDFERGTEILRQAIEASPEQAGFRTALGKRLLTLGEHEEAEQQFLEVLALGGQAAGSVRPTLIEFYSERLEYDKAIKTLADWIEEMPRPPADVRILHADLLIRAGHYAEAKDAVAKLEKPEYRNILNGRLALVQGDPERALELLEQGVLLWPSNAVARILMAEAAEQTGDIDRAMTEYMEALRIDAENWEALSELARLREPLRRIGPLRQLLQRYISARPSDPNGYMLQYQVGQWSGEPQLAQAGLQGLRSLPGHRASALALVARQRGATDPAEAVKLIEQSQFDLTLPANAAALSALVDHLLALSRHADALAYADAAIAAHPEVASFHELRGASLERSDAIEESRAAYERALELEPARIASLRGLGRLAAKQDDLDAALAAFDRAAAVDPSDPSAEWEAIQVLLAADRGDEIDPRLAALLTDHIQHARAGELMARRIVARGGDLAVAQRYAERAVRLNGGPRALTTLGGVYRRQGNLERAVNLLRRSLELAPNAPSARYELGVALARSGDVEAARLELAKALESEAFDEQEAARKELAALGG